VTLLVGDKYHKGALDLDEDQNWIFVVHDRNGKVVMEGVNPRGSPLHLEHSVVGGNPRRQTHEDAEGHIIGDAFHVSAERLQSKSPPSTLKKALAGGNPNASIWDKSYNEEYNVLKKLDTFKVLTKAQYDALPNQPKVIRAMCVLAIKVDEWRRPIRERHASSYSATSKTERGPRPTAMPRITPGLIETPNLNFRPGRMHLQAGTLQERIMPTSTARR
jgi:hypothetical protein